jgi:hypothetical protein
MSGFASGFRDYTQRALSGRMRIIGSASHKQTNEKDQTMNRNRTSQSRITAALIGGALLGSTLLAQADAPKKVTGSHSFIREAGIESLSFQAVQHADGTVTGEAHSVLRDGNTIIYQAHLRFDCMYFLDDHTVLLTGVDVWDSDPEYVGTTAGIIVRDNGQGHNSPPDAITTVYFGLDLGFELSCEVVLSLIEDGLYDFEADLWPAETGNIQVEPGSE